MGGERYQSEQFAREATQAKIAELTLRIKILEHANQLNILSEKHAQRRLAELQGAARSLVERATGYLHEDAERGYQLLTEKASWRLLGYLAPIEALLPHEDAS